MHEENLPFQNRLTRCRRPSRHTHELIIITIMAVLVYKRSTMTLHLAHEKCVSKELSLFDHGRMPPNPIQKEKVYVTKFFSRIE